MIEQKKDNPYNTKKIAHLYSRFTRFLSLTMHQLCTHTCLHVIYYCLLAFHVLEVHKYHLLPITRILQNLYALLAYQQSPHWIWLPMYEPMNDFYLLVTRLLGTGFLPLYTVYIYKSLYPFYGALQLLLQQFQNSLCFSAFS